MSVSCRHRVCAFAAVGYAAVCLAAIAGAVLVSARADAAELSGSMALTSDYVWRGSTQTQGDPAAQAGLKVAADAGFYASVWGSNVEFAPTEASSEFDFTVGWDRSLDDDWTVDFNVLHYRYPAATVDLSWTEVNGAVTYKDHYWASLGYSSDALALGENGTYASLGAKFPINDAFRLEAALGHYFLDDAVVAEAGYGHGLVSAVWAFSVPFEARLTAHATSSKAKAIFGEDFAGSRIEAAVQAGF